MAVFVRQLGIDLGTMNVLVYVRGRGIVLQEPSLVAISVADNKIVALGEEAIADARRGVEGRGYSVNETVVDDVARRLTPNDVRQGRYILLRKGKKTYAMLVVED